MRKFNVANDFTGSTLTSLTSTNKTHLAGTATSAALRRGRIVEVAVGPVSNPVTQDCNIIYAIQRCTTPGTGTAVTSVWVGTQEGGTDTPVPGSAWAAQHSAEPNYASAQRVWTKALNQHSGFIWYSPDEMGLPWPAVNQNGLGCVARGATSDYTGTVLWEVKFEE
jgi:hypothetical protein